MKLWALTTLVHELGHHHDYVARIARGRWRADELAKVERYAEARSHADVATAVLPYLAAAHADEVAYLRGWLLTHGGLDTPLATLIDDPRTTLADGTRGFRWTISDALVTLFEDVEAGRDPFATRVEFARQLHYRGEYALPRAILASLQRLLGPHQAERHIVAGNMIDSAAALQVEPDAHTVPHAPQLLLSVCALTHAPPHDTRPSPHEHAPATHVRPAPHALPHAPQLARSVWRSRQTPPQLDRPPPQTTVQAPPEHTWPAGHRVPHAPQWLLSVSRSRHTPLQLVVPPPQETRHAPSEQICPAGHAIPHAPQWRRSLARSRHAPAQLVRPAVQLT